MIPGSANSLLLATAAGAGGYAIERSLRFNSADSAYLSRTPGSAGNRKTWTWAGWVKRSELGTSQSIFGTKPTGTHYHLLWLNASDQLVFDYYNGSQLGLLGTTQVFRDTSAWMHIVAVWNTTDATSANRMLLYVNGQQVTAFSLVTNPAQNTDGTLGSTVAHGIGALPPSSGFYFNGYLADVHFIDGQALDPTSFGEFDDNGIWQPIAYSGSYGTNGFHLDFSDNSTTAALGTDTSGNGNTWTVNNISVKQVVQASYNSTYGSDITTGEAAKIFDGDLSTYGVANGNFVGFSYSGTAVAIKVENTAGSAKSFYIQPWVSGSATNSGTFNTSGTNAWSVPANTTATAVFTFPAGYDGFARLYPDGTYTDLRFYDIRTAQSEAAGNDSLVDVPTNGTETDTGAGGEVRGNYCTWNPLEKDSTTSLANGNLNAASIPNGAWLGATISTSSGKWYYEVTTVTGQYLMLGVADYSVALNSKKEFNYAGTYYYYGNNGRLRVDGVNTAFPDANTYTYANNDVIGIAFDCDAGVVNFYRNGSKVGGSSDSITGLAGKLLGPALSSGFGSQECVANFGQRPFAYTAPSGFKALCTANLPAPTIEDGSTVMDVVTYTGNGADRTISGLNFSPDLVWTKARSATYNHILQDSVRGFTTAKKLSSNLTEAENGPSLPDAAGYISAGNSDGYDITFGTTGVHLNANAVTYAAWCWDAGSSTVTNTDGSITSSVRANPSAGFSIVTFSIPSGGSCTVGHSLGVAPEFYIVKSRALSSSWVVYLKSLGSDKYLKLESTDAVVTSANAWNNTAPTSTTLSIGSDFASFVGTAVVYAFAPVAGYSAFGSYTGNGSANGPFVYTGFRPRWILHKSSASESFSNWHIYDTARDNYNPVDLELYPNLSTVEGNVPSGDFDILSNGFKVRTNYSGGWNTNGITYIYAAFAEHPFQYARAR